MSEFKLTGNFYVSEWNGNSLNDGTNPLTPYAHPADLPSGSVSLYAICSGYFKGIGHQPKFYRGDGICVFDMEGGTISIRRQSGFSHENIHFKNGVIQANGSSGNVMSFFNCIFENATLFQSTAFSLTSCLILSALTPTQNTSLISCIIVESLTSDRYQLLSYCYLQAGKTLNYIGNSANLNNNCINGIISISGNLYELKFLIDGSPRPDANPSIPDLATAPGFSDTYTTRGNFAGDPKFIDVLNKIVEPDSDLLKLAGPYGYIGGVRPGKRIPVNSSDPDVTITTTDIDTTTDPANWLIQSPATEGFINIVWKVSDNIAEIQKIFLDALLSFDGSETGGSVGNNNVPDNFPSSYSPLTQGGLKPNRLTYELRTSQSIAKPTTEAQWDNDNVALGTTPGAYYVQEWNTKPTIVTVLGVRYGNGNPESSGGSANGINARWAQARIRLTNNRAF